MMQPIALARHRPEVCVHSDARGIFPAFVLRQSFCRRTSRRITAAPPVIAVNRVFPAASLLERHHSPARRSHCRRSSHHSFATEPGSRHHGTGIDKE